MVIELVNMYQLNSGLCIAVEEELMRSLLNVFVGRFFMFVHCLVICFCQTLWDAVSSKSCQQ